jgi:phenylalanyl-tRNA synthetase alpha chain
VRTAPAPLPESAIRLAHKEISVSITPAYLSAAELRRCLELRDLADPAQGPHAMQSIVDSLITALTEAWRCDVRVVRTSPVVTMADNYDHLGYAPDAVTREVRYTRYVDAEHVLRSHSTAAIPGVLRALGTETAPPGDVLIATPGVCYRRDAVDWQHTGTPQQLDLWRLRQGALYDDKECDDADLEQMIGLVVNAALPGARWQTIPKVHPYTLNGRQIDVRWHDQWIEIGECGLAGPSVLRGSGVDIPPWSGLAMGLGLDRLLMLRKGIPDIRLLRSTDPRVEAQLLDLEPYRPVSHMPPVRRDLSVVVGPDADEELLGDRVRNALGDDADAAETVEVLSETAYDDLPAAARERLGIEPGQRNLLIRLVLRPLDRTLTDPEANALRDRVYAAVHEGAASEWAARR